MKSFLKFRLLLWKNYLIQKRKPILTVIEIGLPTFFSLILMLLRLRVATDEIATPKIWQSCNYDRINPKLQNMTLAFSPQNEATQRVMMTASQHSHLKIKGFKDENQMASYITSVVTEGGKTVNNSKIYLGGIAFQNPFHSSTGSHHFDKNVSYQIRFSYAPRIFDVFQTSPRQSSWLTRFKFPPYQTVGPREKPSECSVDPGYKNEGFLAAQHAVNHGLMKELLPEDQFKAYVSMNLNLERHPYPPYRNDKYVLVLQQQFPLIILLSLIIIVLGIVRDIVLEKERKLKESMKMMGIDNWLHWLAWFTKHILFVLISISIMTLFYCLPLDSTKGAVVAKSNPFILFLFLLSYALATITYCFAASVFFKKANTAAAVGGIVFFCLYIPYFFLQRQYDTLSVNNKILACIDFQVAMAFGGVLLGKFEGVGTGIQLNTISQGVSVDDKFSMLIVIIMLLCDSLLHFLIAWYIEAVFPGEFGVPQPWYFPFKPSYWGCTKGNLVTEVPELRLDVDHDPEMFEKEPQERAGIQIRGLRKVFGRGDSKKVAVRGTTLNMYEGQITALLGHNGAGKTTTMSMLTGFFPPTSGTAIVSGYDIRTEISLVRESLGLCPQHDILFDNLTVEEHMIFFGLLKGVKKEDIMPQCLEMLTDMELFPKLKAKSKTLSGGMKRKLSVCIALIGNSKVVFLDEPSSGLDPNARRNIWTVLQKNRAGRTMVLSTHFMDEADLLGDRIAIMSEGVIKCCGSSLFLKKKYGAGYHMVIVKEPSCDPNQVVGLVKLHIPFAEVESNVGAELSFVLPQESVGNFEALFTVMEEKKDALGINSFGASVTTMEEVFIKVGEEKDSDIKHRLKKEGQMTVNGSHPTQGAQNVMFSGSSSQLDGVHLDLHDGWNPEACDFQLKLAKNTGSKLFVQQFYAMFSKRVRHTFRNKLITITQLVVPLFFTIMGLIAVKIIPSMITMPSLPLKADQYGSNIIPFSHGCPAAASMANLYAHQFKKYSAINTVNVNDQPKFKQNIDMINYLVKRGEESIGEYNLKYMFAANFNCSQNELKKITAYFNNQAYHSIAISFAAIFNTLLQYFTNSTDYSIEAFNNPLPRLPANEINDELGFKDPAGFIIGMQLSFGMAFLASSFVLFLVKERTLRAKHIQFVSGVHPFNFWLSTLCWDLINFMIPCLLMIVVFAIFSITEYTEDFHWLHMLVFFFMYGWAMLPYMYLFSFAFQVSASAYVWITMFNIMTGIATMLVVIIFSIPQIGLQSISISLEWVFLALFPNFSLSQGLFEYYQNFQYIEICQKLGLGPDTCCEGDNCLYYNLNYLGWHKNGIGRMLFFLALQGCVMWGFIFSIEFGLCKKVQNLWLRRRKYMPLRNRSMSDREMVQEDDDVALERSRIDNSVRALLLSQNKLVLDNLTKFYGNFLAVDRLSVAIPPGECFGLLGINGAGKTSTFKMLTGDIPISRGNAFLDLYSLNTQRDKARKYLGYCPQFDALIGELTGRETLTLFARLRGVKESQISDSVSSLIEALTLGPYADKQSQTYSGGNKRKLSTAIALIGDPEVIFLDEPTTGMDPVSRRMLWEVLSRVRDSGKTLVLTSHSMEECEALCTRLAIMVNGQFKCLGSIQHLKNKFGEGYTFNAKVSYPDDGSSPDLEAMNTFMVNSFPSCKLTDVHENMVNYHITDNSQSWAEVFGKIERAKEDLKIEDYLVSQTSLEQVFLHFARMQDNPETAATGQR